jgi:hypothetical protein
MALHDLMLNYEAIDVSINSSKGLIAVLNNRHVDLYDYSTRKRKISEPKLTRTFSLPDVWGIPYQILLSDNDKIAVLAQEPDTGGQVRIIDLKSMNSHEAIPLTSHQGTDIAIISAAVDTDRLFCGSYSGEVRPLGSEWNHSNSLRLPTFCPWIEVIENEDSVSSIRLSPTIRLTFLAYCIRPLLVWILICQRSSSHIQLHVISANSAPFDIHNITTPSQVCASDLS